MSWTPVQLLRWWQVYQCLRSLPGIGIAIASAPTSSSGPTSSRLQACLRSAKAPLDNGVSSTSRTTSIALLSVRSRKGLSTILIAFLSLNVTFTFAVIRSNCSRLHLNRLRTFVVWVILSRLVLRKPLRVSLHRPQLYGLPWYSSCPQPLDLCRFIVLFSLCESFSPCSLAFSRRARGERAIGVSNSIAIGNNILFRAGRWRTWCGKIGKRLGTRNIDNGVGRGTLTLEDPI